MLFAVIRAAIATSARLLGGGLLFALATSLCCCWRCSCCGGGRWFFSGRSTALFHLDNDWLEFDVWRCVSDDRLTRFLLGMMHMNWRWLNIDRLRVDADICWLLTNDDWRLFVDIDDLFGLGSSGIVLVVLILA